MLYLTGSINKQILSDWIDGVGVLTQPETYHNLPMGVSWAADNGCFAQGTAFRLDKFLDWLGGIPPDGCLFAVAPDVLADMEATLERSLPVLDVIRGLGYPAALVAQDGAEHLTLPWEAFDALFIGGTTAWKLSDEAFEVAQAAICRGKWLHMGRVNSAKRVRLAYLWGCDSVDGNYLAHRGPQGWSEIRHWMTVNQQARLWDGVPP